MTAPGRRTADDATFAVHLAGWEAREADPDGTVEKVARAMAPVWGHDWDRILPALADDYRRIAQAAIAALRGPATDNPATAVERVPDVTQDPEWPEYVAWLRAGRPRDSDGRPSDVTL